MRSEERSGIIAIVMILLWGTLVTEPFRYFATIIAEGINYVLEKIHVPHAGKLEVIIASVVIVLITLLLLFLSRGELGKYLAPIGVSCSLIVFMLRSFLKRSVDVKTAVALIAFVLIILVLYLLKIERIWIWASDAFILSLPIFLLSSWMLVPISRISSKVGKFFFLTFRSSEDYAVAFKGLFSIPKIVWGIFFAILFILPIAYFVPERRKG